MSTIDKSNSWRELERLHDAAMDARTKAQYAEMESLLEEAALIAEQLDKLPHSPRQVSVRSLLAEAQWMQSKYEQANEHYAWMIGLANDPSRYPPLEDEESLRHLSRAFMNFVSSGCYLPNQVTEHLLQMIKKGLSWLEQIGKPNWSAGLYLLEGLILQRQGDFEAARQAMQTALDLKLECEFHKLNVPGYTLATHKLDFADLMRSIPNATQDDYLKAANLVEEVLKESHNDYVCLRAYQSLAYIRLALGDIVSAQKAILDSLDLASKIGSTDTIARAYQLLGRLDLGAETANTMIRAIITSSNQAIKMIVDQIRQLNDMQTSLNITQLPLHEKKFSLTSNKKNDRVRPITCFVAIPFNDSESFAYKAVLLPALRDVLERHPYYWRVVRADVTYFEDTIHLNVAAWMNQVDAYIADISDLNPNVMMELGYMLWTKESKQPLIVLERAGSHRHLADLDGIIRVSYPAINVNDDSMKEIAISNVARYLNEEFKKSERINMLNRSKRAHYLSPSLLRKQYNTPKEIAEILAATYISMENFVKDEVDDIHRRVSADLGQGVRKRFIEGLRDDISDLLEDARKYLRSITEEPYF